MLLYSALILVFKYSPSALTVPHLGPCRIVVPLPGGQTEELTPCDFEKRGGRGATKKWK